MSPDLSAEERKAPSSKWQAEGSGSHYTKKRWSSKRREERDPRAIGKLLADLGVTSGTILDAACGTGRLRPALEAGGREWVGVDASISMLREARSGGGEPVLLGAVEALPFRTDAFGAVVANRLLHHFHSFEEVRGVLSELLRVSSGPVITSFWNTASFPAWKRRVGLSKSEGPNGRVAHPTELLKRAAADLDAELIEIRRVVPFLSQQCYAAFRRKSG